VAYLGGGPQRAAEVIIAEQVDRGTIRVDSRGRLSQVQRPIGTEPAAALDRMTIDGLRTSAVCRKLKSDPAVGSIRGWLQAQRLLVPSAQLAFLRLITLVLFAALVVTGIARVAEGVANHRPVSDLVFLLIVTVVIGAVRVSRVQRMPMVTRRGSSYLKRLRQLHGSGRLPAELALSGPSALGYGTLAGSALFAVALDGFVALPDEPMRTALMAGMPTTFSSSGGSGASSCGGGSGCGGGGCGGGGCGG
jgi:uncharacterized protein (TIGR04222 family)